MGKKILYIVLGALLIFGLLFVLWSWWSSPSKTSSQNTGTFGTASSTQGTVGVENGQNTNGQTPLGSPATNGTITLQNSGSASGGGSGGSLTNGGSTNGGSTNGGSTNSGSTNGSTLGANGSQNGGTNTAGIASQTGIGSTSATGSTNVSGVDWLSTPFNATGINGLNSGANGFAPTITTTSGGQNTGLSLGEALAGVAITGTLSCALQAGLVGLSSGGSISGAAVSVSPPGILAAGSGPLIVADYGVRASGALQNANNAGKNQIGFLGCITNTIAKTALQQITLSVVNWINSGFNGQPSFVNDYQQFFTNVADAAAGQFIQGSGLAFLCSPFQLQIKIAIAQAYANRGAQSCTLSKVISNINGFMNGNFAQGGWPGFISFTTVPTNNPYGAFAYAQAGLANAQSTAQSTAKSNISPTGFLNLQKLSGCDDPSQNGIGGSASIGVNPQAAAAAGKAALPSGCKATVVTPGSVIAQSLGAVNKSGIDQLGLANDLDQIISALTTQLTTRVLQTGLSSISQTTTQTSADIAAQSQALTLLNDMQTKMGVIQQLGPIYQGSINDIEQVQGSLNSLANCWSAAASSTSATPEQQSQASANSASTQATLLSLNDQVTTYNNNITQLNSEIATLNQFESQISLASSDADVTNTTTSYNAAIASGFPVQADVTTAQQNRTTLQAQMSSLNASTQTSLTECDAYPH